MGSFPLILNSFATEEECSRLIEILDPMAQPSPRDGISVALSYENSTIAKRVGVDLPVLTWENEPAHPEEYLASSIFNRVREKFDEVFGEKSALTQGNYQIMYPGSSNGLHSDTTDLEGNPLQPDGTPEEMEWSGILYLNTHGEDFIGGTLVFPNQNVEVFPVAGDLVLFPGTFEYIHMVPEVLSGERKNLVFFYGRDENVGSEVNFYVWQDKIASNDNF